MVLTEEQKKRIEENRLKALAKRQESLAAKPTSVLTTSVPSTSSKNVFQNSAPTAVPSFRPSAPQPSSSFGKWLL
jgi:hypothetical protein